MLRLRMAAAAALALVVAGCGTAAGTGNAASPPRGTIGPPVQRSLSVPPPSSHPATRAGGVLTVADAGERVMLRVGQRLTIDLAPGTGVYAWHGPRLAGDGLRLLSVTGGYPSHGLMRAALLATGPGTIVVSSFSDMPCLHEHPSCLVAQQRWTATVVVQAYSLLPQPICQRKLYRFHLQFLSTHEMILASGDDSRPELVVSEGGPH